MSGNTTVGAKKSASGFIIFAIVALVAVVAYVILTAPDTRTGSEKIGDAVQELPQGLDKAARQLEDRTPGEKLGDAVQDAGEEIKTNTDR